MTKVPIRIALAMVALGGVALGDDYPGDQDRCFEVGSGTVEDPRYYVGSGRIIKTGAGTLVLSGDNSSFTGDIVISNGAVRVDSATALGKGSVFLASRTDGDGGGRILFNVNGACFTNRINVSGTASHEKNEQIVFKAVCTLAGPVASDCNLYFLNDTGNDGSVCTVDAPVWAEGCEIGVKSVPRRGVVDFRQSVVCDSVYQGWGFKTAGKGQIRFSAPSGNVFKRVDLGYAGLECGVANALPENVVVQWIGSNDEEGRAVFYLPDGLDQVISSLGRMPERTAVGVIGGCPTTATYALLPVTLTLKARESNVAACILKEQVSLVYDAQDAAFVQTLSNGVHTTTGGITVKNGTLRLCGATSLPHVLGLHVQGGALELETTLTNALVRVAEIDVAAGATLRVRGERPFADSGVFKLSLADESTLDLPDGHTLAVAEFRMDGRVMEPGVYTHANCSAIADNGVSVCVKGSVHSFTRSGTCEIGLMADDFLIHVAENVVVTNTKTTSGAGALVKLGLGTLVLNTYNAHTGGCLVSEGRLVVAYPSSTPISDLDVAGSGPIDVTGGTLVIEGQRGMTFNNLPNDIHFMLPTTADVPGMLFRLADLPTTGDYQIRLGGAITAEGDLHVQQESSLGSAVAEDRHIFFDGDLDAGAHTVYFATRCGVDWNGRVTAGTFSAEGGYPTQGQHNFNREGNRIDVVKLTGKGGQSISCGATNALSGVVDFLALPTDVGEERRGHVILDGYDQRLGAVNGGCTANSICYRDDKPSELTLTGGVARASFAGKLGCLRFDGYNDDTGRSVRLSVTVDDAGDGAFVQDFSNNVHITYGTMRVKKGTLSFSGAVTSLPNVPEVIVEGGTFALDTAVEGAMPSVTNVTVAAGGVFRVSERVRDPFGASETMMSLAADGSLEIPAGADVTVERLNVDGRVMGAGVYSGDTDEGVRRLPQIVGKGVLRVRRGSVGTWLIFK